jgi:hypothetical protein
MRSADAGVDVRPGIDEGGDGAAPLGKLPGQSVTTWSSDREIPWPSSSPSHAVASQSFSTNRRFSVARSPARMAATTATATGSSVRIVTTGPPLPDVDTRLRDPREVSHASDRGTAAIYRPEPRRLCPRRATGAVQKIRFEAFDADAMSYKYYWWLWKTEEPSTTLQSAITVSSYMSHPPTEQSSYEPANPGGHSARLTGSHSCAPSPTATSLLTGIDGVSGCWRRTPRVRRCRFVLGWRQAAVGIPG